MLKLYITSVWPIQKKWKGIFKIFLFARLVNFDILYMIVLNPVKLLHGENISKIRVL